MADFDDINTGKYHIFDTVFIMHVHVVSVTKYPHQAFSFPAPGAHGADHARRVPRLRLQLAEFYGQAGHLHLLVSVPPTAAISCLASSLKSVSSRRPRQEFPDLRRHYWRAQRLWSGSYFAGSVGGAPISVLRQYIEQQNRPS